MPESKLETKKCSVCHNVFPATLEHFNKQGRNGLRHLCKKCQSEYMKAYRQNNNNVLKQKKKEYAEKNREKIKEYKQSYYQENIEAVKTKCKEYREENKERKSLIDKAYRETHKEQAKIYKKQYRQDKKEELKAKALEYYNENKKAMYLKNRRRVKLNVEKTRLYYKIYSEKRRAKANKLLSDFTIKQWNECKTYFNSCCAYCGKLMKRLEQDHFIALNNGGGYTKNNIVPACRSCNASKNDKFFNEWYPKQAFYLKERECKILEYLGR